MSDDTDVPGEDWTPSDWTGQSDPNGPHLEDYGLKTEKLDPSEFGMED